VRLALGPAEVRFTERADGDALAIAEPHWRMATQVHGTRVVVVDASTDDVGEADALVTTDPSIAVAVRTADCAPVVLAGEPGVVGVAHAGWRGLLGGVIEATVAAMRAEGATSVAAALGPCIGPECYEFSAADVDVVAARYGDGVRATTKDGRPALDVRAGVRAALAMVDVPVVFDADACTACDAARWFSHRARGEVERMASVAWLAASA
jgi:YfiH family protein